MKKKTLLTLFALLSLASMSMAQVSLVPKAGITFANVAMKDDKDGQKSMLGFTGGLGVNFALTADEFLSLQPELLYVQKGYAAKGKGLTDYNYSYKLNYLELPVLLKIGFGSDVVKGYVNLGPSIGYLLNGRFKGSGDLAEVFSGSIDEPIDFVDNNSGDLLKLHANRLEFGANFGGGLGFQLGAAQLLLDLRYNAGLSDFNKDTKSKNQVIYLTTGIKIPLAQR